MKAAILVKSHEPLVLADIELPRELSFGQVLVKVLYSGICGTQINEIDAVKGEDKFLPHLLGHEGSGVIVDVGPGVKTVQKGDHVVMHWRKGAGIESETPTYRWKDQKVNAGWVTTFNEMAVVSENRVTAIPKDFDMSIAPLFGCAITTAMNVVNNDAHLKIGESIVVVGVGGVGLNIVQASDMVSANPIVAIDLHNHKLEMAKKWGATHCINSKTNPNIKEEILKIVGPKGADVIVETTGIASLIEMSYELTQPQGRTILVGVPKKGDNISIYSLPLHFKKVLKGSHGGDSNPSEDIPRYIRLHQKGRLKLAEQITHRLSFDSINKAIQVLRSGEAGRCVLNISN
ncbi:MAG: dehydrogenase [Deltaproteobacteria bacterium RIFCSPLOWO2_01_44_7]|nr:MAG: dehydrogenase [Deltaproteobacteria bacterium RIFCSPHIGHO2_01_FULL_43_49]OGQ15065.1 MAG: dehydrogenase [Deltaproteobacteria bacterium RIFCSPHIGHO2_02_FULL_44_53]OGQ27315.1 MAG: dehydrogenase [Deltaproteobacteria bacterium RIFCSPHIGHO2_12_FULL_44_21]OGQ31582.1 MAG: dehydrogenase [Deltaproteobacteria bacterium RIFCSPLOWO2_01_FULL_45_74]OGQ38179.1 MAG: dehydrogenase [Deltaproteobacteria bacterium RIFCSPLOWO2_01_44_7]OGQ42783.1 MAG: dehydrogenase [Deltaproteobacteria bacterium RIFCSPLOWO2_0